MLLSIIIINYDTIALVKDCLESIAKYRPRFDYEIILVNNGSKSDQAEELRALAPEVTVIDLPSNVGFGRANNWGIKHAQGDYLLQLNSDTYYVDDSLNTLMEHAIANPQIDFMGVELFFADGRPQEGMFPAYPSRPLTQLIHWGLKENPFVHKFLPRLLEQPKTDDVYLHGCHLLVKREAYHRTKGMDPDFYLYFEEVEWFYARVIPAGYGVGKCAEAKVVHIGGASQDPQECNLHYLLSRHLFLYKLHRAYFFLWLLVDAANIVCRAACIPFVPKFRELNINLVSQGWKAWRQAVWDVPRFSNTFGSREAPLMRSGNPWTPFSPEDVTVYAADQGRPNVAVQGNPRAHEEESAKNPGEGHIR